MEEAEVKVMVADESHIKYIDTILTTIAEAAKKRGSGIAKRSPEYVATKMREAKAVIALQGESSQVSATSKHGATSTMLPHQV